MEPWELHSLGYCCFSMLEKWLCGTSGGKASGIPSTDSCFLGKRQKKKISPQMWPAESSWFEWDSGIRMRCEELWLHWWDTKAGTWSWDVSWMLWCTGAYKDDWKCPSATSPTSAKAYKPLTSEASGKRRWMVCFQHVEIGSIIKSIAFALYNRKRATFL